MKLIYFQKKYIKGEGRSDEIELNTEGIGKNVPGPYWLDVRKKWLKNLLEIVSCKKNAGRKYATAMKSLYNCFGAPKRALAPQLLAANK